MSESSAKSANEPKRPGPGRSPAYPSVPLKTALEKARAQYEAEGRYPVPLPSAFKAWGFSPKSSGGRDVRASMRYFGIIIVEGDNDLAKIKLTEDALRVLTDKRDDKSEKIAIIRRLALNPAAHKKLWAKFPDGIKSEATAVHFLVWEENYNESAAQALVTEYKETIAFAGLDEPADTLDILEPDTGDGNPVQGSLETRAQATETGVRPPPSTGQVAIVNGERVAFTEESQPGHYLKLIASGEVDDLMLEALEDFVKRQRKRLAAGTPPVASN